MGALSAGICGDEETGGLNTALHATEASIVLSPLLLLRLL